MLCQKTLINYRNRISYSLDHIPRGHQHCGYFSITKISKISFMLWIAYEGINQR